jgi:predicted DNA-binding transcriptional regulator YafY
VKSDRLLSILLLLQTRGLVRAAELAERLEVSVRTIYRDVEALSAAGVPVYTERGRHGGIALLPGYRTDVTGLTEDESRALFVLAAQGTHAALGLDGALDSALRKVMAALPEPHRPAAEQTSRRILADPARWRAPRAAPDLDTLTTAVFTDRRLRLHYRRRDATEPGHYLLDPYGLVVKAGIWYLVADKNGSPRFFRADRVISASVADEPVRRRPGVELATLWETFRSRIEGATGQYRVRARVRTSRLDMFRGFHSACFVADPVPEGDGGWTRVELAFPEPGTVRTLLAFGPDVEVTGPDDARRLLARTAADVLRLHDTPAPRTPPAPGAGPRVAPLRPPGRWLHPCRPPCRPPGRRPGPSRPRGPRLRPSRPPGRGVRRIPEPGRGRLRPPGHRRGVALASGRRLHPGRPRPPTPRRLRARTPVPPPPARQPPLGSVVPPRRASPPAARPSARGSPRLGPPSPGPPSDRLPSPPISGHPNARTQDLPPGPRTRPSLPFPAPEARPCRLPATRSLPPPRPPPDLGCPASHRPDLGSLATGAPDPAPRGKPAPRLRAGPAPAPRTVRGRRSRALDPAGPQAPTAGGSVGRGPGTRAPAVVPGPPSGPGAAPPITSSPSASGPFRIARGAVRFFRRPEPGTGGARRPAGAVAEMVPGQYTHFAPPRPPHPSGLVESTPPWLTSTTLRPPRCCLRRSRR